MKTSLVIPAYNEEKRLGPFLQSIAEYLRRHRADIYEVIVVDDGSNDATVRIARKFEKILGRLRIIIHPQNKGKGAAVRTGVLAAKGEYVVFMDADGATPISELPKMLQALQTSPIAVGNRWMPGAKTERHSLVRQFAGWVNRSYMRLFGLGQVDTMCGFKGYERTAARRLFTELREERWLFDTEVAYRAVRAGYSIHNFPIRWESKDGSKLSLGAQLKSAVRIWPLLRRVKRERRTK